MTKKATRSPSNIFSMFEKRQIDEFKEVNRKIPRFKFFSLKINFLVF